MSRGVQVLIISMVSLGFVTGCALSEAQAPQPEISTVDIHQLQKAHQGGETQSDLVALEIEIDRTCFAVDDPLPLEITLRNTSDSTITVAKTLRFMDDLPLYGVDVVLNGQNAMTLGTVLEIPWPGEREYVSLLPGEGAVTSIENLWDYRWGIDVDPQQREVGPYDLLIRYENFIPGIVRSEIVDWEQGRLYLKVEDNGVWVGELHSNPLHFDVVASADECR